MEKTDSTPQQERLYLDHPSTSDLPLHTSITLFLLSYCECKSFQVFLVSSNPRGSPRCWGTRVPEFLGVSEVCVEDLPGLVRVCRLPAVLDGAGRYCRAGLAVVLRHIVSRTVEADSCRGGVSALLGFKSTCLKACAEVSPWTRLCELSIPSAVESLLLRPSDQSLLLPDAILQLEKTLGEPVKVHNNDKIRRQKLRLKKKEEEDGSDPQESSGTAPRPPTLNPEPSDGLELQAALAKLSVGAVPPPSTRECSEIRKVKTAALPALEHVFAEGLYFTLTDMVLLPCIHHFLISLQTQGSSSMLSQLPLLLRWYLRVQEVPGVALAAEACGLVLSSPQAPSPGPPAPAQPLLIGEAQQESPGTGQVAFVGGPRPTMTKLKGRGIEAIFSPHPCPSWSLSWDCLPASVNPTEGRYF
ncbi:glutathione S-transferase C-terminal domain-containing protein [Osmerus eperlanus]|uniref:glutathione S-transferase C-terminal domain-containing protein n=1 Tax=Osmerus eperlanus TaxID=29151 RepID=UPI002E125555